MANNYRSLNWKPIAKSLLKIGVSGLLLYVVYKKLGNEQVLNLFTRLNWWYVVLAFIAFNIGQNFSVLRSGLFLKSVGVHLGHFEQIKLFYKGMLYNLILPGGIGGDGYKVLLIKRLTGVSAKSLVKIFLTERLAGMAAMCTYLGLFGLLGFSEFAPWNYIAGGILLLGYPAFYVISFLPFIKLEKVVLATFFHCHLNQFFQIAAFLLLIQSAHIPFAPITYGAVFLMSSIAIVIPISIGGVGLRESVFVLAASYLSINANAGVVSSVLFFLINATSSVFGLVLPDKIKFSDAEILNGTIE